jgi:hypothetical protein
VKLLAILVIAFLLPAPAILAEHSRQPVGDYLLATATGIAYTTGKTSLVGKTAQFNANSTASGNAVSVPTSSDQVRRLSQ